MEFNHYNSNSLNQSTVERKERRREKSGGNRNMQGRKGDARKEKGRKREGIKSWDKYQQGVRNKLL